MTFHYVSNWYPPVNTILLVIYKLYLVWVVEGMPYFCVHWLWYLVCYEPKPAIPTMIPRNMQKLCQTCRLSYPGFSHRLSSCTNFPMPRKHALPSALCEGPGTSTAEVRRVTCDDSVWRCDEVQQCTTHLMIAQRNSERCLRPYVSPGPST